MKGPRDLQDNEAALALQNSIMKPSDPHRNMLAGSESTKITQSSTQRKFSHYEDLYSNPGHDGALLSHSMKKNNSNYLQRPLNEQQVFNYHEKPHAGGRHMLGTQSWNMQHVNGSL